MSWVKEELHIKAEEGFGSKPVQDSHYQSLFISGSPQEGGVNPQTKENVREIKVDRIELTPQTVNRETGGLEDKPDLDTGQISKDQSEDEFDEIEGEPADAEFICKDCKRPFTSKKKMIKHKYVTKGNCLSLGINWETMSCTLCSEKFDTQESASRHPSTVHHIYQARNNRKSCYNCDICGKKIGYKDSLRDHKLRSHYEGKSAEKFKCNLCNFTSPVRRSVTGHMRSVHGEVTDTKRKKALKCSLCDHSAPCKSRLLEHIMIVHQKIKDHVCKHCGFATSRKQNLTLHVRSVHCKEKPFQCTICGHTSAQSNALTDHIEIVHTKPPKRERTCFICNKLLSLRRNLKGHLKKEHSVYKCQKCDHIASDAFGLNYHYEQFHR